MKRIAVIALLLALPGCASSPASSPESEALKPAPVPVAQSDTTTAVWREELVPGDVLKIVVWRRPDFTGEFVVGPNGKLLHPLYQTVDVVHLPPDSVQAHILAFLLKYDNSPQFYIEPLYRVLVTGEVHNAGIVNVPQTTTLPQALALAGGPTQQANLGDVRLVRGHSLVSYDLTAVGLLVDTLHVRSGDQVTVTTKINFLTQYAGPIAALVTMFISIGYFVRHP